ncbi:unnamed protein product, partial [Discosporangium mesarthrocarpum]
GLSGVTHTGLSQSRTECHCDYLVFYKDSNRQGRWGEERYTGRDGTQNWPGCDQRPPLEIPASQVYIYWSTDSSVTDWGWRMTVTAELGRVSGAAATPGQLQQRLVHAYQLLYEQVCP